MPATFFLTGETLEADAGAYRELLADPLFEVASHTYSHRMLRDHCFCGPAASEEAIREELLLGKESVERVFGRPCVGLRPGCGFPDGLRGAPDVLQTIVQAGFGYVSSSLWGPDYTMPAPLAQPFDYGPDGAPGLWELPGHGWHDNLLKDHNNWGPRRLTLWPPDMPDAVPHAFATTAQEEFAVHRRFIERACAEELTFVSLIWHPWSLARLDPEMEMLDLVFARVRELGMTTGTYADLLARVQAERPAATP
jgi:peptidoglycan/xylan/chitin deacetylase (PgdA/CDA1 family)